MLAPTQSVAREIKRVVVALGDYMGIKCHACIGGTNVRADQATLEQGSHVIVGTPGRVHNMISCGKIGQSVLLSFPQSVKSVRN